MFTWYALTPQVLVLLIVPAVALGATVYLWRDRGKPGAIPLMACLLVDAGCCCAWALETGAAPPAALLWHGLAASLAGFAAVTTTFFVLEFTSPGRWVTPRNVVLLLLPPILFLGATLTVDLPVLGRGVRVAADATVLAGPALARQLMGIYSIFLILANLAAFGSLFVRSPHHRWLVAQIAVPWILLRIPFQFSLARLPAPATPELMMLALVLAFISYTAAIRSYRTFSSVRAARQALVEQIHAGLLVFDAGWRIVSLNPAAEVILGVRWLPRAAKPGRR